IDLNDPIIIHYPPYYRTTITLASFVDNNTGVDYVAEARRSVLGLLNPENRDVGAGYWHMSDGVLTLGMDISGNNYFYLNAYGRNIPVKVNLQSGEVKIDEKIVDAVTKARKETSERLGIAIEDVHVNSIMQRMIYYMMLDGYPTPKLPYILGISTPQFNLTYNYNSNTGTLKLILLVNRETGVNLYAKAIENLKEKFNPEKYSLSEWKLGENNLVEFKFNLGETTKVSIKIDMHSGIMRESLYNEEFRDSDGSLLKTETKSRYDEDGRLIEETYQAAAIENGRTWWACEHYLKFDAAGNVIEGYQLDSYYAGDGMLTQMNGVIGMSKDGVFKLYTVSYDIDENGNVVMTHLYDENGVEVGTYEGFEHPSEIISVMTVIDSNQNSDRQEAQEELCNQEILARKAIEELVARQAADKRFVNEMAEKAKMIEQPQVQNQ
ncbi:MAG: hypothetical protein V1927_04100, partial [Candidatus Omnitrophota bacterium]